MVVKAIQQNGPLLRALFDLVQLLFQPGRISHIEDIRKILHQQVANHHSNLGGIKSPADLGHIFAVLNGVDDRGISRWTADSPFFENFHQRGFVVARRRRGEVLLVVQLFQLQQLHIVQIRQLVGRFVVVVLLLLGNLIDLQESVEAHHRAAKAKIVGLAGLRAESGNLRRGHVKDGRHHLRSDKALPDEPVELQLLFGQRARNRFRSPRDIGGADGFVRVLRGLLALVQVRRGGQIFGAQLLRNPLPRALNRLRRHARRVGSHVGDEAGRALRAQIDAFVEPLRHAHRPPHIEPQLAGRIALQLAGDERRQRLALLLAGLNRNQRPLGRTQRRDHRLHRLFIRQRIGDELVFSVLVLAAGHSRRLAVDPHKARLEGRVRLLLRMQKGVQRPVLDRLEGAIIPQKRRNLVAHQAVQHPPRLLRVHQILIQIAGVLECLLHGLLGNLVEGHAVNLLPLLGRRAQLQRQVVGNRLALAVRVRRQVDFVRLGRRLLQLRHNLFLARRHDQGRVEGTLFQFHAELVLGQVHDVTHRRQNLEARAQIFPYRLGLGRRLDDDQ